MMNAFKTKNLTIYPTGEIEGEEVFLSVAGSDDKYGWHSSEVTSLSDEDVDNMYAWLHALIAERSNVS